MADGSRDYHIGGEDQRMLAPLARQAIGDGKVSQEVFGALIGRSKSIVVKREGGSVALTGTAQALYVLLAKLGAVGGLGAEIFEALEGVPKEMRSEASAIMALLLVATAHGRLDLVAEVVGAKRGGLERDDEEEDEVPDDNRNVEGTLRLFGDADTVFQSKARASSHRVRAGWAEARKMLAALTKQIEMNLEEEAYEAKSQPGDPPDGGDG